MPTRVVILGAGFGGLELTPIRRARRGQPLTREDALWKLVGSTTSAPPTDATKKHEYLAEAFTTHHPYTLPSSGWRS